jgi:antigen flippase
VIRTDAIDAAGDGLPRIAFPAEVLAVPHSPFVRNVLGTLLSRAVLVGLTLLGSVIVARALGPAGRGDYSVAVTVAAIGVQLANLGLHTSSSWAVAREPALRGRLLANGMLSGLVIGTAVALVLWIVSLIAPNASPLPGPMLWLALASIPVGLVYLTQQNLMLGLQWVRAYNALDIANRAIAIVLLLLVLALSFKSEVTAYATVLAAMGMVAIVSFSLLARSVHVRPDFALVRRFAGFGLRAYSTALFTYLVLRVDLLMVQYMQGSTAAGQYSVAVGLGEMIVLIPTVVATIMFPRLSAIADRRIQHAATFRTAALMGLAATVLVLPAAVFAGTAIRLLYGEAFDPALPAFLWLLPGLVFLSVHTILMAYFLAIGTPFVALVAPLVGLSINVVLNVLLIPTVGFVGASVSSTLAYGVMLAISASAFARRRGRT